MGSIKGHLRNRLVRARKKSAGKASIWLFYSLKLDEDIPIIGDLEMLYWVSELEIQPQVKRFTLECEVDISLDEQGETFKRFTVTRIEKIDGSVEFHQIDSKQYESFDDTIVPVRYRVDNRIEVGRLVTIPAARLRVFSNSSLSFWLKVIAFVSQVRGYDLRYEMGQVGTSISLYREGTINEILESVNIKDSALAIGAICRTILQGHIIISPNNLRSFGLNTPWRMP